MLDRQLRQVSAKPPARDPPSPGTTEIGLPHLINFWRRQRLTLILTTGIAVLLGAAYLMLATPQYTASTSLLIETRKLAIFSEGDVFGEAAMNNSNLETQVQLLLSGRISESVAKKLDLMRDEEFMNPAPNLLDMLVDQLKLLITGEPPSTETVQDEKLLVAKAASILRSNLEVKRVGLSYVINVSYTSENRAQAADIANAYTVAYVEDLFNAQLAIARRGSDWLLARIRDLNERSTDESLAPKEKSAIRTTYDTFLQRYTALIQQQSLPATEARVVTPALVGVKTSPNRILAIGVPLVLGAAFGFGIGLVRDLLDRAVRTQDQVEAVTGAPFLGYLPQFNVGGLTKRLARRRSRKETDVAAQEFSAEPAYSMALTAPFSQFSETLRNIKLATEKAVPDSAIVVGITSSMPNEGKSTVAINLARLAAQSGSRTLLIDGDLRGGGLSSTIVPPNSPGLVQVIRRETQLGEVIWSDRATRLHFLPTGVTVKLSNATEILNSMAMEALLGACRRQYDLIVVDVPAVLPVVDARAVAHLLDGMVFIVEWGYATEDVVAQALHSDDIADKVIGVVLNKVNLRSLKHYQDRHTEIVADKYREAYRHVA